MSDVWEWFRDRAQEYIDAEDVDRFEMARVAFEFHAYSESDPAQMIQELKRGRDLAKQLNEPWWAYLYEVWIALGYQEHLQDLRQGLQESIHAVNEGRKPILHGHPWKIAATNTLLACYVRIDPIGYEPAIRQCIAELDKEIPPGPGEHRFVMMEHYSDLERALGDLPKAERIALDYIALFDQSRGIANAYLMFPVQDMCWISYHQGDFQKLMAYAMQTEEIAQEEEDRRLVVAEAKAWQAICERLSGNESKAKSLIRMATNLSKRFTKVPDPEYFDALAYFHQTGGDFPLALAVRDEQLAKLAGKGQFGPQVDALLKRAEVLQQLGQFSSAEAAAVREAFANLKNPKPYEDRLSQLIG